MNKKITAFTVEDVQLPVILALWTSVPSSGTHGHLDKNT